MYTASKILTLYGIAGWRVPTLATIPTLDASNKATKFGEYFDSVSKIVTLDNIYNCMENKDLTELQWNAMLKQMQEDAILRVVKSIFNDDGIIENRNLFNFESALNAKIANATDFVGYEIELVKCMDIKAAINSIITSFDGVGAVKILVFHSSQQAPVYTEEITTQTDSDLYTVPTSLMDLDPNTYQGGKWYIGYLRSGLTVQAYDRDYEDANIQTVFNVVKFEAIKFPNHDTETLPDVTTLEYTDESYGLNFNVSTYEDFTKIILNSARNLNTAILLQMAEIVLEMIINSNRENANKNNLRNVASVELTADIAGDNSLPGGGIRYKLTKEIERLKEQYFPKSYGIKTTIQ